jgi:branched-chain amino acid transport system substrate-binding protein
MKKYVWLAIIVVLFAFVISKCSTKTTVNSDKETIKIGLVVPLSGNQASSGHVQKNAALMAFDDISAKNNKYKYELIIEDDGFEAKKTVSVVNKLISVDKVDAIVSFSSHSGNVIAPIAQNNKVIHISLASDNKIAETSYNFINWTTIEDEVIKMVNKINDDGVENLAILIVNHPATNLMLNYTNKFISDKNTKISYSTKINSGTRDFKSIISKVKQANPDLICLIMFTPEQEIFVKQLRELGVDTPLTGIELFAMSNQKELFNGAWYVDAAVGKGDFNQRIKKYTKNDNNFGAVFVYDSIMMLNHIYESLPSKSPEIARLALENLKSFDGAAGKLINSKTGIFKSEASVKIIKDGQIKILEGK